MLKNIGVGLIILGIGAILVGGLTWLTDLKDNQLNPDSIDHHTAEILLSKRTMIFGAISLIIGLIFVIVLFNLNKSK